MKLSTRLFALIVLTLLPILGIEIYDEIDVRSRRAAEGEDQALRLVRMVANEQSKVVEGTRQLLIALGKTPILRSQNQGSQDQAACNEYLADLVQSYPQFVSLAAYDRSGRVTCAGAKAAIADTVGSETYFHTAMATGRFTLGQYVPSEAADGRMIQLSQPYWDTTNAAAGIVAAGLSIDWLNHELAHNSLPPKATVSVIDRNGVVLARYPEAEKFVGTPIASSAHSYLLSGQEGVREALGFDGVSRIYAYAPLPGGAPGMTLSIGLDKAELLKVTEGSNQRDITAIIGSLVLALLLASVGARVFIAGPIQALVAAAERWRCGELDARVQLSGPRSEFGRLGAAFNAMAVAIGAREQDLERRVQERTEALKAAMEARHEAEAALHEARKMETIGRLTGGVAHDFNNLLAAIVGNIELAKSRMGKGHAANPRLDAAMASANRGAVLVQQLLAFARRQNLRPEVVDLNHQLRNSRDMLQRLLRSDVAVEIDLCDEAWTARVDPSQLEAAILNLAINARDAMPNGGRLRLTTDRVDFQNGFNRPGLVGQFVALTVADTGTGIPSDVLDQVFEPFFTTKEIGAGSGLGLSMVQGFARQSAGAVCIDSEFGRGTSVTLYLPRATGPATPMTSVVDNTASETETILLVEDDAGLRGVLTQLLEQAGFSVIEASNGSEALGCFRSHARPIDIMVTDLVMADGMSGAELVAAVRGQRPGFPVLMMTGFGDAMLDETLTGHIPILMKPFQHAVLIRRIRELLSVGVRELTDADVVS